MFQELSSFFFNTIYCLSGAHLKEANVKNSTFDSGNYLKMWVTFYFFKRNRMNKLKIASKRSELDCNNKVTNLETWAPGKYTLACNLDYSLLRYLECHYPCKNLPHDLYSHKLWDNFKKGICVSRTIVNTEPPSDKIGDFLWTRMFGRSNGGNWPYFYIGFDDYNVYLSAFKLSTLYYL